MIYSHEVEEMCTVAQGVHHGAAPIPEEAKWVKSKEVKDFLVDSSTCWNITKDDGFSKRFINQNV